MIAISKCDMDDSAVIAALDSHIECGWSQNTIVEALKDKNTFFFKAELDGKTIGYISFKAILDEAEIYNIAVFPEYRRLGCASRLISEVKKMCEAEKIRSIFLEVNERNSGAQRLYENCGFKRITTRKKYYGEDSAYIYCFSLE